MGDDPGATKRRKGRKWPIAVAVAAVVAVVAGAVCHDPMDNYVNGYFNDAALLANAHAREGATCLECHEAKIDDQVREGLAWVSGDYETDETGDIVARGVTADKKMCAAAGCHDWEDVVATTRDWGGEAGVNPHRSHQGEAIDCSNCHGVHESSRMYCNACHDYEVPDGWASAA